MRLDKKRDSERAQRQGLAKKTIIQVIWFAISALLAYFVFDWLFTTGELTYNFFYNVLSIPRAVPEFAIMAALILIAVMIMQFFLVLGYVIASPQGRERTGRPSAYSSTFDPMEDDYRQ